MKLLSLLACASLASAANLTDAEVENLENYWSYGRSDPVYPTPQGAGTGVWTHAYELARALVGQMTNAEKRNLTTGYPGDTSACSGRTGGVPRLGFPGICVQDAGNGVRSPDMVNAYPAGIHVGASWNRDLAYERAYYMGQEFRAKGVDVMLGPVFSPLGRVALGGRNWEGFSSDPYLSGSLGYETIEAAQENVMCCAKHIIGNEQETDRIIGSVQEYPYNVSVSSNIDDKTMHELYLWPFQDAVRAGVGSMMCSCNKVNGSYACENSKSQNGLIKGELGFQGFIMSDWGAGFNGVAGVNAGLDVAMPMGGDAWINQTLLEGINNGSVAQSRLDDMSTRIVATWMFLGANVSGEGMVADLSRPHPLVDARVPESKSTIFQGAVEGQVLVKNTGALPLNKPRILSVFGYDSVAQLLNGPGVVAENGSSMRNVLTNLDGTPYDIHNEIFGYTNGIYAPECALNGTLFVGGGSGANSPAYIDAPLDALKRQAYEDDTYLSWDAVSDDPLVNADSDACLVFINSFATEGLDRHTLSDSYSDNLVNNVAANCSNTIVVIHNAGIRLVDGFYDNPNVTAIVYAHLPGQDTGRAIVEVLYGKQAPSGRLPYTVARQESDYGPLLSPTFPTDDVIYHPQSNFSEGVYIDYKYFLRAGITPRFPFGFGLTYTNFSYANLGVTRNIAYANLTSPDLYDVVATVSVDVTNTGSVSAAEVPQLYLGIPNGPARVLRGYGKADIAPGRSHHFTFDLTRRDLSTWDVVSQSWVLQSGDYSLYVGKNVLDIQLNTTISF